MIAIASACGRGFGLVAAAMLMTAQIVAAETAAPVAEPSNSAATQQKPAEQSPAAAAAPAQPAAATLEPTAATTPIANPVIEAASKKLSDKSFTGKADPDDVAALVAFYATRTAPLWTQNGTFTDRADKVMSELKKADDWGLEASAFTVAPLISGASADAQGEAEASLALAALKYARFARGGRVEPLALSNILDMKPPLKDPKAVLAELADSASPDAYLRGLNPKHAGFEKLRQALLKARGPVEDVKIDEALKVKLPDGKTIKPGAEDADIALLRKRLKVEAQSASNENLFDAKLEAAVRSFQQANGLKSNGQLTAKTRAALNREGEPKKVDPQRDIDRLVVNMERWRWLPEDLGSFYVMNNIPEFTSQVMKGNSQVLKMKMIDGQPTWPTPVLAASMEFVIFHPDWGVPDGIKVKELLPRLKRASSQYGNNFFDQLFGGGSASGGGRVLAAYKLQPTLNGRPVDANSIDWNNVDIRRFSFTQPPGGENPLGLVKFRFPNRHDVYMHDTPQKGLFEQSFRALSHGCMRLENPRAMAEVILAEDKGWSTDKVGDLWNSGGEIKLDKPIPVYLTYFTARVEDDGRLLKYGDVYGHDERLMSALQGKAVRYNAPEGGEGNDPGATISDATVSDPAVVSGTSGKKSSKDKKTASRKPEAQTAGDIISDALSGLLAN